MGSTRAAHTGPGTRPIARRRAGTGPQRLGR